MKLIRLSVDDVVFDKVRAYAERRKTTVDQLIREHLEYLALSEQKAESSRSSLLRLIDSSPGRMGTGWRWKREDAYEGRG
jgi:hypothetical protein